MLGYEQDEEMVAVRIPKSMRVLVKTGPGNYDYETLDKEIILQISFPTNIVHPSPGNTPRGDYQDAAAAYFKGIIWDNAI